MTTAEFLSVIQNKILTHLSPRISGVPGAPHAMDVAAFLFQVGIFFAREESGPGGGYNHYSFRERPHLLRSRTSLDDGCSWELHPVFRQALGVRGADGGERRVARSRSKAKSTGRTRR
jgi:hypothetical protein